MSILQSTTFLKYQIDFCKQVNQHSFNTDGDYWVHFVNQQTFQKIALNIILLMPSEAYRRR